MDTERDFEEVNRQDVYLVVNEQGKLLVGVYERLIFMKTFLDDIDDSAIDEITDADAFMFIKVGYKAYKVHLNTNLTNYDVKVITEGEEK